MTFDQKTGLLGSDLLCEQGTWHIHIGKMSADGAVHVVVPVGASVKATGLVAERKLQNDPVLGQQVERSVDRSIGDRGILGTYPLENLAGSHMTSSGTNLP